MNIFRIEMNAYLVYGIPLCIAANDFVQAMLQHVNAHHHGEFGNFPKHKLLTLSMKRIKLK